MAQNNIFLTMNREERRRFHKKNIKKEHMGWKEFNDPIPKRKPYISPKSVIKKII